MNADQVRRELKTECENAVRQYLGSMRGANALGPCPQVESMTYQFTIIAADGQRFTVQVS